VSQAEAQQKLDRYPMRSAVKVYYDPAEPPFGILQPGRDQEMEFLYKMELWFIGVFTLAFVAPALWYDNGREPVGPPGATLRGLARARIRGR
jgi:hypothetical protein